MRIPRPGPDEFGAYYLTYIDRVEGGDAFPPLAAQRESTARLLAGIPESRAGFRYAPGKWTLREVIGHLSDAERIFAYRLLRIARGDATPLASFDENRYVPEGNFERRPLAEVAAEFAAVRDATLALLRGSIPRRWSAGGSRATSR